jgi:hypothetical protein
MDPIVSQGELLQRYNGHRNEKEYMLGIARLNRSKGKHNLTSSH